MMIHGSFCFGVIWDLKLLVTEGFGFFFLFFFFLNVLVLCIDRFVTLFRLRTNLYSCLMTPHHLQGSMLSFGSLKVLILQLEQLISVNAAGTNHMRATFPGFCFYWFVWVVREHCL